MYDYENVVKRSGGNVLTLNRPFRLIQQQAKANEFYNVAVFGVIEWSGAIELYAESRVS